MEIIQLWLSDIKSWYQPPTHSDPSILINAVNHAPDAIFDTVETHLHSEALVYWIDACQRLSIYYQNNGDIEKSYSYLQFCYAKLQEMACKPSLDVNMKRWCLKKLDRLIIRLMEFCQCQTDAKWQQESSMLIELHVSFMKGQNHLNLAYSSGSGNIE